MPRGRPSLSFRDTPVSERTNSPDMSSTAASARITRSGSTKRLSMPTPTIAKRPGGRPSRASLLANESISSLAASAEFTSASEYSTPATSNVATPAPSVTADGPSRALRSGKQHSSIEVHIPAMGFAPSEKLLRRSQYSLNPVSKRKLAEVGNSDDEDEDEILSDESPDAVMARRLQNEEYSKAGDSLETLPQSAKHRIGRASASSGPQSSHSSPFSTTTKGRGRASKLIASRYGPSPKRSKVAVVSDTEDDLSDVLSSEPEDDLEVEDSEMEVLSEDPQESDDSDDEVEEAPMPRRSAKTSKKPQVTSKAKGKAPAAPARKRATATVPPASKRPTRNTVLSFGSSDWDMESIDSDSAPLASSRRRRASRRKIDEADADEQSHNSDFDPLELGLDEVIGSVEASDNESVTSNVIDNIGRNRRAYRRGGGRRVKKERDRLETHHPELLTMWTTLEEMPVLKAGKAPQPKTISRQLKPFQLEGLAWMMAMEKHEWKGGLLGDEMGLGKTIQAVSLIMSDYPAKQPSLVLVPPVALMQWVSEIASYTDGTLKTFVFHGTNSKTKGITVKELKKYNVIIMSYNSLESMYRKQEKGFTRKDGIYKEKSLIHQINFHRVILDEAHSIKTRTTMTAKACFALKVEYRWCLSGTPLQNRIGEFFSLIRFLNIKPFASYLCKQCPCSSLEWNMGEDSRCSSCDHAGVQHVSVFNQELLNPIQKYGSMGPGKEAFRKLRLMTERIMLRRLKKDHTNSMELPVKEIYVDRQFFGEEENDFANSIMTNGQRKFETYVAQGVLLNNYANIFGLIMQMRQVADHPDLILKKNAEGGQNVLVCCICDEPAEDTIRSRCRHDFCRSCARSYLLSSDEPDCPQCHIPLSIDLEQPEIEQDEAMVKKSSIINRIKMENWTSSSKIELLVHELHRLRSNNASHKSIIFSQFTTMLQLIEWRLRRAGFTTVMLDGSMTPAQRQASIEHFMTNVDVEVFLVSLKAGGVALNLTEASRVFIVDPWWNPAAEWQSADRCHRIGQTRPCTITRLCIEDSVESRMVLIQEKKTNMIHSTVNADDKAMESLSPEDMQFLFRGS